ncbi:hypothetical protein PTTG_30784 [Puccinia triticina 1-1 BBBD Race 1]|uniref:Domain of unknown function at the cortex 1 domain-containing protein n=1 Tax=Puccinia triticina (isolate 1-1 / race 1 (BBBD)) TaxID=630390 RepID=A0A180FXV6_PUCT1|nr:hypothetical protein PTTG_30784 [Puccinia triticina 1-1 BBBD Race 1]
MFANMLNLAPDTTTTTASAAAAASQDPVQELLGPWRFKNPTTDILEDNTFVFLDKSVNVQKRRKHFSESGGKHRKAFVYDPDVVYATSFFSPFMDFNTFDLAIGPVKITSPRSSATCPSATPSAPPASTPRTTSRKRSSSLSPSSSSTLSPLSPSPFFCTLSCASRRFRTLSSPLYT